MPENAAAEGGFGLGANEAFGGQVGTGSLGGSEVGGAQGSFGGGEFGGGGPSSPAAQAAAASQSIAAAEAVFGDAGVQNGLLGMMGLAPNASQNAPAQSMAPSLSAPAIAAGFNPEAVFGMSPPSQNPSTGGLLAGSPAPSMAPSVDSSTYSAPDLPEPEVVSPAAPAAMVAPTISMAPTMSLADQSFNPEAVFGMVAPSQNPTTGGLLAGSPMPDMAPVADTAPAINADPIASYGTGTSAMSVDPAAIGGNLTGLLGTPAPAPAMAPAAPAAPAQTPAMSPATISQDMMAMAPAVAPAPAPAMSQSMTSRPQARPTDDRSFLGRTVNDIQMGLSINPFASRQEQAQSLIDRGWNPTDVSNFMARSINTDRSNQAMVENQVGADGYTRILESAAAPLVTAPATSQPVRFYVPRLSARGY